MSESALCAYQCAQMWGSSAEAHAHWLYFYRSAAWQSCSAKSQLNINLVFSLFPSARWSKLSMLMVHLEPRWTGEYGPWHLDFSVFQCGHNHPDFYRYPRRNTLLVHHLPVMIPVWCPVVHFRPSLWNLNLKHLYSNCDLCPQYTFLKSRGRRV